MLSQRLKLSPVFRNVIFRHFALSLSTRYNIFITFEEYIDLCGRDIAVLGTVTKSKDRRTIGFIDIHDTKVLVIKKASSSRHLITCLPNTYNIKNIKL